MKDIVRLKSYPNGIRIVIAEDALFGDVLAEVSENDQALLCLQKFLSRQPS